MHRAAVILLGASLASACATGRQLDPASDDSAVDVELVVQNQTRQVVTAYIQWDGGRPVRLGEVRGGATGRFQTPPRGSELRVIFENVGRAPRGRVFGASPSVALAREGDRFLWVLQANRSVLYQRLQSS